MKTKLHSISRLCLLVLFQLLLMQQVQAQSFKLHAEYRSDWYGPGYDMLEDIPGYPSVTLQAESTNDQFVIEADASYNKWRKFPAANSILNQPQNYALFAGITITDNFLEDSTQQNYFYTTRIKNQGYNSTQAIVMGTQNMPVSFNPSNPVAQLPMANNVSENVPVTVAVSLFNPRSPEENVFVRYTTNNWQTSIKLPVTFPNQASTFGGTVIPGLPAGTQVSYYAFTTTLDSAAAQLADADLITLRFANNQGTNYNYTVGSAPGATCNVVFSVNMSGQTVSPQGVFLAGTFNSFSTTSNPMTLIGNNIYVDTVSLDTSISVQYKFVNGTGTGASFETVPLICGLDDGLGNINRNLAVPNQPIVALNVVCFNLCDNSCAPTAPFLVPVVFRVNMSQQAEAPAGVFLAGSFNAFSTTANPMDALGNGIYVDTLLLDTATVVQYKFVNGSTFELVPGLCGVPDGLGIINRQISVPNIPFGLPPVCFGQCTNCTNPDSVQVTFRVNMSQQSVSPQGVYLTGSFNNFDPAATPMTNLGLGIYSATVWLDTTLTVQYKFLNGNTFAGQESVPQNCGVLDGFGGYNRALTVPNNNAILPAVCFSACLPCQAPVQVPVFFRVDMSQETISPQGVFLAGSFNGFSSTANQMTSIGNNIYADTILVDTNTVITYKFVNGSGGSANYEIVPTTCGIDDGTGIYNRSLSVGAAPVLMPVVCFAQCFSCIPVLPTTVNVVFQVNMSQQTISPQGVFVTGSFNGWNATGNPMQSIGNGIYVDTIALDTTSVIQYKFLNGNTFATEEVVPFACGVPNGFGGYNRSLNVPENDVTLPAICFGTCAPCITPVQVPVVFRVNMSQQVVSPQGVYLAGTFNGFSSTANPMDLIGNGIYVDTLLIDTGYVFQYKFVNGSGTSAVYENVPVACGSIGGGGILNREYAVGNLPVVLPVYCFGECNNCILPTFVPVVFRVNMSAVTVSPNGVYLAGSFNNFSVSANPMTSIGNGIYVDTLLLDTIATVYFKYLNDSTFFGQEAVPSTCGVPDGFASFNRVLNVPNTPATLAIVCFSSCTNCVLPVFVDVTFRVNMSQQTVSPNGVFLSGTFNNFNPLANPMTDIGAGVYEAIVSLDTTETHEYKFVNGTSGNSYELVPASCAIVGTGGVLNRAISVPENDSVLATVCFAQCTNCVTPVSVQVVLQVNMSQEIISPQGVFLAGTFNGFSSTANPMVSIGNGVYVDTITVNAGSTIQYKFVNGSASTANFEIVPSLCGTIGGGGILNRQLTVNTDTSIAQVCFGQCTNCVVPTLVNIVFRVDMSGQVVSPQGVHLSGSFNAWSATANPMTAIGNGVFVDTLSLDTTLSVEYKFINGNTFFGQEAVPSACGVNDGFGGFNRAFSVPAFDSTLALVCFSSCGACVPVGILEEENVEVSLYPNPSQENLFVSGITALEIYNVNGQLQLQLHGLNESEVNTINIEQLPKGVYIVRLVGVETSVQRLIKQ